MREERPIGRYPGGAGGFALFGEVMLVGLLVGLVGVAVVTLPAGLAAGAAHLRRYARAEDSSLRLFWADVRSALAGGVLVGICAAAAAVILAFDVTFALSGALGAGPLAVAVGIVGAGGLVLGGAALLMAAGHWGVSRRWRSAVRDAPRTLARRPIGLAYLSAAVVLTVTTTWMLPPLLLPALGCAAFAAFVMSDRTLPRL